jgi:hypothetical protein
VQARTIKVCTSIGAAHKTGKLVDVTRGVSGVLRTAIVDGSPEQAAVRAGRRGCADASHVAFPISSR